MLNDDLEVALTFDDVLLIPAYSEVLPGETALETVLARDLKLAIPLLSAAMDTVTEARVAAVMARLGGIGVIHKNLSVGEQAAEVRAVKDAPHGGGVVATLDALGRLRVAAAVGVGTDRRERAAALVEAGVDALVVDTAHGHSRGVIETTAELRAAYPTVALIAGNVATAEATRALVEAGADAVKCGIGPGSICTTRVVAGVGVPQLSAIAACARAVEGGPVKVIADGGIKHSGDVTKALAAGAHCVMIGSLLAGTDESPGEVVECDGRWFKRYRGMGSLGAMKLGSRDRYFQQGVEAAKLVPEGVEALVPARGELAGVIHQLLGGLRAGMGYTGCPTIEALRLQAHFLRITPQGLRESHVHDVSVTAEPPNYRVER